jgi:predicted dehydrogenase
MSGKPLNVVIVGCGNIAGQYAETLKPYPQVKLLGASDIDLKRAGEFIRKFGGHLYESLDSVLSDKEVDAVINLTIHHAHPAVITQCLKAGKHVHSEKPLALTYEEAKALADLADARGLRLSCSPMTYMGEAQQTAWKAIREGRLGTVRAIYAEVNWGRIEDWHPNPSPFYDVGALFDVGVYPLTLLTTIFGPATRVTAFGKVLYPDRSTSDGKQFRVNTPDWVLAAVELSSGAVLRLTTSFYVGQTKQTGIEFHGDRGALHLGSFQEFDAAVEVADYGQPYVTVPPVKPPFKGTEWGRAVFELAEAIRESRPHRPSGRQAAHVVEILCAIAKSSRDGSPQRITSTFAPSPPMPWGL